MSNFSADDMEINNSIDDFYYGLQALSKISFPKKCSLCQKVYENVDIYIKETLALEHHPSGLSESYDPEDKINTVELYRNCTCGSTLMDFFSDRRDLSQVGEKRRKVFKKLLDELIKRGSDVENARKDVLLLMKGTISKRLRDMGVKFNPAKK